MSIPDDFDYSYLRKRSAEAEIARLRAQLEEARALVEDMRDSFVYDGGMLEGGLSFDERIRAFLAATAPAAKPALKLAEVDADKGGYGGYIVEDDKPEEKP